MDFRHIESSVDFLCTKILNQLELTINQQNEGLITLAKEIYSFPSYIVSDIEILNSSKVISYLITQMYPCMNFTICI